MDFINNPAGFRMQQQMQFYNQQMPMMQQAPNGGYPMQPQMPMIDPRALEPTPILTSVAADGSKGVHFTVIDDVNGQPVDPKALVIVDNTIPPAAEEAKKRRGRPRKSEIIRDLPGDANSEPLSGQVVDAPTSYSYMETTNLLRETLDQIDALNGELVQEFTNIKNNKFLKNKYNTLSNLSENISSLLSTKVSAIREINSSISKANDLDYKKMKDVAAIQNQMDDDKYVADMYKSFISNPQVQQINPQFNQIDQSVFGSNIIRATVSNDQLQNAMTSGGTVDAGYLSYLSNLSPEQNAMRYESNPNVKQVVVWDKRNNAKFFQVMDVSTGQVIPNVPTHDPMFMEDTTIDVKNMIAKNMNLRETYPLVIINDDGVTSEY